MADLLIDTDVFIDHLKGFERLPRRQSKLAYSIVTRAELFAGPEHQLPVGRADCSAASRRFRSTGESPSGRARSDVAPGSGFLAR